MVVCVWWVGWSTVVGWWLNGHRGCMIYVARQVLALGAHSEVASPWGAAGPPYAVTSSSSGSLVARSRAALCLQRGGRAGDMTVLLELRSNCISLNYAACMTVPNVRYPDTETHTQCVVIVCYSMFLHMHSFLWICVCVCGMHACMHARKCVCSPTYFVATKVSIYISIPASRFF